MPPISKLLQSNVYRLMALNLIVFLIIEGFFYKTYTGLELHFWKNPEFEVWQLFSNMFLHSGVSHLALNMFALWSFGRILEQVWGKNRFLLFYLFCGVSASVVHEIVTHIQYQALFDQLLSAGLSSEKLEGVLRTGHDISRNYLGVSKEMLGRFYYLYHTPTVGASGAIYGLLVAFALIFPNFKVMLIFLPVPVAAKYFVPVLLLIDLSAGITGFSIFGENIAHFAHIGGAISGALLVLYWKRKSS